MRGERVRVERGERGGSKRGLMLIQQWQIFDSCPTGGACSQEYTLNGYSDGPYVAVLPPPPLLSPIFSLRSLSSALTHSHSPLSPLISFFLNFFSYVVIRLDASKEMANVTLSFN